MTVVDIYLKCSQLKHDCNIILKEGETTIVERFLIADNALYCEI